MYKNSFLFLMKIKKEDKDISRIFTEAESIELLAKTILKISSMGDLSSVLVATWTLNMVKADKPQCLENPETGATMTVHLWSEPEDDVAAHKFEMEGQDQVDQAMDDIESGVI